MTRPDPRRVARALALASTVTLCIVIAACGRKLNPTRPEARSSTSIVSSLAAAGVAPAPGVVAGGFCTSGKGFFGNNLEAAERIQRFLVPAAVGGEILHVGDPAARAFTWQKTGTLVTVRQGGRSAQVDAGVAAMLAAVGAGGRPGALSVSRTNPEDMGTGGNLAAQALTLKLNQRFSELFLTPATGFSGLSLVDMETARLGGAPLTAAQANALNGQATLQVADAVDLALGQASPAYELTFGQMTDLLALLNEAFASCGTSDFARSHLYQPFVTSSAFGGRQPSTVSNFAAKPAYHTFSGLVVFVGTGCNASDYAAFPAGAIALVERGTCTFYQKAAVARAAGASGVLIFNSTPETGGDCPAAPTPGSSRCEALVGMGAAAGSAQIPIPAAFVQRSAGLLLRAASGTVSVTVQQ